MYLQQVDMTDLNVLKHQRRLIQTATNGFHYQTWGSSEDVSVWPPLEVLFMQLVDQMALGSRENWNITTPTKKYGSLVEKPEMPKCLKVF